MNPIGHQTSPPVAAAPAGTASLPLRSISHVLIGAIVAGLLLGPADLLAQTTLPYPWANLANSGAVWALGAFLIGMWSRQRVRTAAAAGGILLLVAVHSYYLATVILLHDSTATLWSATTVLWLVLGVIVGQIFGVAGSLIHSVRFGVRFAAAAFAGSMFMAEAIVGLGRSHGGQSSRHELQTALIEISLAVMVSVVLLSVTRTRQAGQLRAVRRSTAAASAYRSTRDPMTTVRSTGSPK